MEEYKRLQEFVDVWGASATKAKAAQSRVKMIEKMRKEGKLDPPPSAVTQKRHKPSLVLPDPPKGIGEKLLVLQGADIGYDEGEGAPILEGIDLVINRGMKLILRGPNGAGKSSKTSKLFLLLSLDIIQKPTLIVTPLIALLSALRGKLPLLSGKRIENEKLRLGSFTQDLAQELDAQAVAMDLVLEYAREGKDGDFTISNQDARGVMGRLGLSDEKPLRKVADLSGGEKARVALSMFALKASNLLLLDEPSNHLDVECIEALGESLSNWGGKDGSVVVVSHDRSFCETIGFTHVGTVKDGGLVIEERGLDDRDWERYDIASTLGEACDGAVPSGIIELTQEEKAEQERKRKLAFNAPKRIEKIEQLIEKAENKIAEYDEKMMECKYIHKRKLYLVFLLFIYMYNNSHYWILPVGNDMEKLMEMTQKKSKEEESVTKLMEEWESLEEIMAEMSGR